MAVKVKNTPQLLSHMRKIRARPPGRRPKLYAFLLFDERESQRPVAEFAQNQFAWLDQLAGVARIILFLFVRPEPAQSVTGGDSQIVAVEGAEAIENPSLRVATAFNVRPRDLPGILFFTQLDLEHGPNEGLFWPLSLDLFEGRLGAEDEFAQLFSLIQEVQPADRDADTVLEELKARLRDARRERFLAPVFGALRNGAIQVVKFPGKLAEVMGQAWATELARRMAPQ